MVRSFKSSDRGKKVVTADGETIGTVEENDGFVVSRETRQRTHKEHATATRMERERERHLHTPEIQGRLDHRRRDTYQEKPLEPSTLRGR